MRQALHSYCSRSEFRCRRKGRSNPLGLALHFWIAALFCVIAIAGERLEHTQAEIIPPAKMVPVLSTVDIVKADPAEEPPIRSAIMQVLEFVPWDAAPVGGQARSDFGGRVIGADDTIQRISTGSSTGS